MIRQFLHVNTSNTAFQNDKESSNNKTTQQKNKRVIQKKIYKNIYQNYTYKEKQNLGKTNKNFTFIMQTFSSIKQFFKLDYNEKFLKLFVVTNHSQHVLKISIKN